MKATRNSSNGHVNCKSSEPKMWSNGHVNYKTCVWKIRLKGHVNYKSEVHKNAFNGHVNYKKRPFFCSNGHVNYKTQRTCLMQNYNTPRCLCKKLALFSAWRKSDCSAHLKVTATCAKKMCVALKKVLLKMYGPRKTVHIPCSWNLVAEKEVRICRTLLYVIYRHTANG